MLGRLTRQVPSASEISLRASSAQIITELDAGAAAASTSCEATTGGGGAVGAAHPTRTGIIAATIKQVMARPRRAMCIYAPVGQIRLMPDQLVILVVYVARTR
jgi:hypothetical protein